MKRYESWGRYPQAPAREVRTMFWRSDDLPIKEDGLPLLAYGKGRSYGDVCLNEGGVLVDTEHLGRLIAFDDQKGLLRCEAGMGLDEILQVIVPRGWFLPVTPGTKYITVGGAIANDVHGKNHHKAGTFGRHVTQFELLRSDGQRLICSPTENGDLFRATIGGLGLTGFITWAEFRLMPISTAGIVEEKIRFANLDEFFAISGSSDKDYEYTVAWVDCLATGEHLGRGIFMRGNHAAGGFPLDPNHGVRLAVPVDFPNFVLNPLSMKLFNEAYYNIQRQKEVKLITHYEPFFYPLDAVKQWNRIYGPRGFLQYQCVLPPSDGAEAIREIIRRIARSGNASFLAVLKEFGDVPSPGMLSFPRPGITLTLDIPFQGTPTLQLLAGLDGIVRQAGGALYPAKDARMSAENFQTFYPQWQEFSQYIDPHFSSSFWRRVTTDFQGA